MCPYALLLESSSRGLSETCGLLLCLPLPSYPVYFALMNFEYRLKKIEERNSANHNPSRPDRWLAMQISVSFMLLGRTRAKWACTLMKFIHPQTVELPDQLSNMVKSTVHVCVGQAISHIYTVKCDWQVSQSLTWLPSIAMGPNLEINTFFKKETFLFLSAQWAAVSTLT